MKQPDLGKKILELRLAKGLTQSELAEKCNIGLRTIQRIEAAEVTPRSYTVKLIFTCLDYEIYSSFGKFSYKLDRMVYRLKNRLGQLYKYVLDLFNLKTNAMKKITILSLPCISIILLFFLMGLDINAQDKQQVRETIVKKSTGYTNWFNSGQIDSVGTFYLEKCCMIPDNFREIHGKEGVVGYNNWLHSTGFRFTKSETKKIIVSDSIAIERGVWKATGMLDVDIELTGTYLTQWRLIDGGWFIENEMTNADNMDYKIKN